MGQFNARTLRLLKVTVLIVSSLLGIGMPQAQAPEGYTKEQLDYIQRGRDVLNKLKHVTKLMHQDQYRGSPLFTTFFDQYSKMEKEGGKEGLFGAKFQKKFNANYAGLLKDLKKADGSRWDECSRLVQEPYDLSGGLPLSIQMYHREESLTFKSCISQEQHERNLMAIKEIESKEQMRSLEAQNREILQNQKEISQRQEELSKRPSPASNPPTSFRCTKFGSNINCQGY